jgi:hypothetical protein
VALCAFDLDGCEPTLEAAKAQFQNSWDAWKAWAELREDT